MNILTRYCRRISIGRLCATLSRPCITPHPPLSCRRSGEPKLYPLRRTYRHTTTVRWLCPSHSAHCGAAQESEGRAKQGEAERKPDEKNCDAALGGRNESVSNSEKHDVLWSITCRQGTYLHTIWATSDSILTSFGTQYASRRFGHLSEEEIRDMHDYIWHISSAKGSGEYALSEVARVSLIARH